MTRRLLLTTLALALAACGHSQATRFWTLDPVPPPGAQLPDAALPGAMRPVRVAAVHIPLALDRAEVVQPGGADRLAVRDLDHWGAPLGSLVRLALTRDLVARLPAGAVVFPDAPASTPARSVVVDVLALGSDGGDYRLEVGWTLLGPDGLAVAARGQARLATPLAGPDVAAQVAATGRLTGQLADRIVQMLAQAR
ncbi:MAG: PqiC family protein [Janthinobacterium lividum]